MPLPAFGGTGIRPRVVSVVAVLVTLSLAGGCASTKNRTVATHSGVEQAYVAPGSSNARRAVSQWGRSYEKNPQDRRAILGYASALRHNGQLKQSMAVLRKGIINHGNDREIASAYGKVLAMNGRFNESLNVIKGAQNPEVPDWRLMSAEAAVYDQMGNHKQARALYSQALKIVPNEPSILNNLGLSHMLSNELPEAEYNLRKAASLPQADSRVRQNLALALGLQGKFEEAERVALAELDPEQAKANIVYLKTMMDERRG